MILAGLLSTCSKLNWLISFQPVEHRVPVNLSQPFKKSILLTSVVTIVYCGFRFPCIVRNHFPFSIDLITFFCIKKYPLQTCYCPLHHLTFWRVIGQQKKWIFSGKRNGIILATVSCAAESNFSIICEPSSRESPSFSIWVWDAVIIIPANTTVRQSAGARSLFINTVLTYKR